MQIYQKTIVLPAFKRGFHLITNYIDKEISSFGKISKGICNLCIQHTSASLTLNENCDPDVRRDFETFFNHAVPESFPRFEHTMEGSDDMPAHIKTSMMGATLTIPVTDNCLNLGTWQGVYLGEHRNYGGQRRIVMTIMGE